MVLKIVYALGDAFVPKQYLLHIFAFIVFIIVIRAFSQGRTTDRERDLHARVIIVTGGFTPLGITLLQSLGQRGAHIIALSPHPITSPNVSILIDLLRSTTSNEQIYAEECDLASPNSVKEFCTRFLTGETQRLDALVFAHEYHTIGSLFTSGHKELGEQREIASLATFLIITLLLPALLVAPVERDIRIINVINPFYAAAVPSFSPGKKNSSSSRPSASIFVTEGKRSLQMAVLTRHLQRVLDALPSGAAQLPKPDEASTAVPVVSPKAQQSNIVAVSVSPGISRSDTIAPLFGVEPGSRSTIGLVLYILFQPLLRLLTKSSTAAMQSVLHVLFLPTPFKLVPSKPGKAKTDREEVLKPGALYSECAAVKLRVPIFPEPGGRKDVDLGLKTLEDNDELGGEVAGRLIWEEFEAGLKAWELAHPPPEAKGNEEKKES